jgi:uncharacterized protein (UPF0261 family)
MPDIQIAVTIGPLTRSCGDNVRRVLIEHGWPICSFAVGAGRAMEVAVLDGHFGAVLDLTLTELAAEVIGAWCGAGPDRMTAAGLRGIPQVIVLGGLEAVGDRPTTPEELDRLGQEIATKASAARGPTTVLIPLRSVSPILIQSLQNWLSPNVRVRELDLHVNDPEFAAAAVEALETELRP